MESFYGASRDQSSSEVLVARMVVPNRLDRPRVEVVVKLKPFEVVPRGYGFSYYMPYSDHTVVHPIPFNFVMGAWNNLYWYVLVRGLAHCSVIAGVRNYWRDRGFEEGRKDGYEAAFRHIAIVKEEAQLQGILDCLKAQREGRSLPGQDESRSHSNVVRRGSGRRAGDAVVSDASSGFDSCRGGTPSLGCPCGSDPVSEGPQAG